MDIDDAISRAKQPNSRSILFLGAGFANSALNLLKKPVPAGSQLSKQIVEHLGEDSTFDLSLAVDHLRNVLNPKDAFDFIDQRLTTPEITKNQYKLLSYNWHRIYTTNIDNIGSDLSGRPIHDAIDPAPPLKRGDYVYLHGKLAGCNQSNYYSRVKMGEQLYLSGSHSNSFYHSMLAQDLAECDVCFVVGYSMADPDLSKIFYCTPDLINKCFVFSGVNSPMATHRIRLIGTNTELSLDDLVTRYESSTVTEDESYSLPLRVDYGKFSKKIVSQDARQNLLIFGRYDENIARTSWSRPDEPTYVIPRSLPTIFIENSGPQVVVLHSHLGNGKSLIYEYLKTVISQRFGKCFFVSDFVDAEDLILLIESLPMGSNLIIEIDIFQISKCAEIIKSNSIKVWTSCRTTTLRAAAPGLYESFDKILRIVDVNTLERNSLEEFHDLIDTMAFWPTDLASKEKRERLDIITKRYDASISAITLEIFENQQIKSKIAGAWQAAITSLRPIIDHIIIRSYMQTIDVVPPSYIINEFQNLDYNYLKSVENDVLRVEHNGNVMFGNAILGQYILRKLLSKEEVIGAIVRFANFIDSHPSQKSLQWFIRRMLRYWNLERLIGSKTVPREVFDRASYIPSVAKDPLFWVQYSIAEMENLNYLAADRFTTRAYAESKKRKGRFDTYQIDTHQARLTLRRIIDQGVYEGASSDIADALQTLDAVIGRRPDDRYHVASVICMMLDSDVQWIYLMSDMHARLARRSALSIASRLNDKSIEDVFFVTERKAVDLINRSFGGS